MFSFDVFSASGAAVLPSNNGLTLQYNTAQEMITLLHLFPSLTFLIKYNKILLIHTATQDQSHIGHRVLYNLRQ